MSVTIRHPRTHAEWLRLRRTGIGSSDIPALMGTSPYRQPIDVWYDKLRLVEDVQSDAMRIGLVMQAPILELYRAQFGPDFVYVKPNGSDNRPPAIYRQRGVRWASATPDAVATHPFRPVRSGNCLVEAKAVRGVYTPDWEDGPPDHVRDQALWQSGITQLPVDVAVLIGGFDFRVYEIERDECRLAEMLAAAYRFLREHVWPADAIDRPPPGASKQASAYLAGSPPSTNQAFAVGADSEIHQLAIRRAVLNDGKGSGTLHDVQRQVDALDTELKRAVGVYEGMIGPGWSATFRPNKTPSDGPRVYRFRWTGEPPEGS